MTFQTPYALLGDALAARGYSAPTSVQAAVLEDEAVGRDLIVSAQTGSGKTVAFGLAMAPQMLAADGGVLPARTPLALGTAGNQWRFNDFFRLFFAVVRKNQPA